MESIFLTLIGITVLFFLFLIIKNVLKSKKMCVICSAVSLTWIVLLVLYFTGIFADKIIIGILMGMSALGLFYKFYDKLSVFKLPFLLTLITLIYSVLEKIELNVIYILIILWLFFALIYLFRSNKNLRVFANKLIECCKKW